MKESFLRRQTLPHEVAQGQRRLYPHEQLEGQPFVAEPPVHLRTPRATKQREKWMQSKISRRSR